MRFDSVSLGFSWVHFSLFQFTSLTHLCCQWKSEKSIVTSRLAETHRNIVYTATLYFYIFPPHWYQKDAEESVYSPSSSLFSLFITHMEVSQGGFKDRNSSTPVWRHKPAETYCQEHTVLWKLSSSQHSNTDSGMLVHVRYKLWSHLIRYASTFTQSAQRHLLDK